MEHAKVSQEAANRILQTFIKEKVQSGLNGVLQSISEMSSKAGEEGSLTRYALLRMVEASFAEIMEEQRRRVRVVK